MDTEHQTTYDTILRDLENDRAALELLIEYVKRKKLVHSGDVSLGLAPASASMRRPTDNSATEISSDAFFSLGLADAAKKYLKIIKRPKGAREIATALELGGFHHASKDFYNTVFSVLNREASKSDGEFVKVKKEWGLVEWYPGLKRGAKTSKGPVEEALENLKEPTADDL